MKLAFRQTIALTARQLLALWRQPSFVAITLVQPMVWLLPFGALFRRVVEIPGFHGGSYIEFLTPGVVVMSALFSAGWHGMSIINAIDRGIMDRFLVSPVRRGALIASSLVHSAIVILIQSLVIIGVAFVAGACFSAGAILLLLGVVTLLGGAICALSEALALATRQEETLIGAVRFVALPATFLSSAMMASNLMPGWMREIARFNPLNWAIAASRSVAAARVDWTLVATRTALLAVLLLACAALATRAVGVYQRSV